MSRNMLSLPLLLFCLLLLHSCEKDSAQPIVEPTPVPVPHVDRVNFQTPTVGQFNTYEMLSFECGTEVPSEGQEFTLSITEVTESTITFEETWENQPDPYSYVAQRRPGNLLISAEDRSRSGLFYFYGSDSIRLNAEPTAKLDYRDCVFYDGDVKFTGDYVAEIPKFEMAGVELKGLKSVSCVPVILDLDGYLLYNKYSLMGSITTSSSEFGGVVTTFTSVFLLKEENE
ncbi:MAG: hypothetical protein AAGA62_00120 [Bacteroidota bacterium]